jgi:hypothetical protein
MISSIAYGIFNNFVYLVYQDRVILCVHISHRQILYSKKLLKEDLSSYGFVTLGNFENSKANDLIASKQTTIIGL